MAQKLTNRCHIPKGSELRAALSLFTIIPFPFCFEIEMRDRHSALVVQMNDQNLAMFQTSRKEVGRQKYLMYGRNQGRQWLEPALLLSESCCLDAIAHSQFLNRPREIVADR